MRYDGIIFDLDGTLVDSFQDIYLALKGSAADLSLPIPTGDEMLRRMHLRLDQIVSDIFPGVVGLKVMQRFRERYDGSGYPNTFPYPGVEGTIKVLSQQGFHMFVATNKRRVATEAIISRLDVEGAFEMVVTSDISSPPMDKKGLVRKIMMDRELEPARTALVGDTRGDWDAAIDNGIQFVLANYGYGDITLDEIMGEKVMVISSFKELAEIFIRRK